MSRSPHFISKNIDAIRTANEEYLHSLPQHQKWLEKLVAFFCQPAFLYVQIGFLSIWIILSRLNTSYHIAPWIPHYSWVDQGISVASLLISTGVLIHESMSDKLNDQRNQLVLQLCLSNEKKVSKTIQLLEELRKDLPSVPDRFDVEASRLQDAADPAQVLEMLQEANATMENMAHLSSQPVKADKKPFNNLLHKATQKTVQLRQVKGALSQMSNLNGVMMQYFHWYIEPDGNLWNKVKEQADTLSKKGVTALWLPPAYKGQSGGYDVGYGVYDLFDLGEFDQKGSVRTKYGTKDEFVEAVKAARQGGIRIYADAVFNHKLGGDAEEEVEATPFSFDDRQEAVGEYHKIKTWTHYQFPGRSGAAVGLPEDQKKYSNMEWRWWHFDAVDYNAEDGSSAIYLLKGKSFDDDVDQENNGYDYLMGCDLDIENPEVKDELKAWGKWIVQTTGVDGFRFDAVKHVTAGFFEEWLSHVEKEVGHDLFAVGEYWSYELSALDHFLNATNGKITLFDAPLHYNFHQASVSGNTYDLRQIFTNTLVQKAPTLAVTLVENHDSQPLQALESVVEPWFKPLAYALILLRGEGYPCIFYGDYYGAQYKDKGRDGNEYDITMPKLQAVLDQMLEARQTYAYGDQYDYFDHPNTIGWTRLGTEEHPGAMAVVLSNGSDGSKWMEVAQPNKQYYDITQQVKDAVTTNEQGWGEFRCNGGSVSVWVPV